MSSPTPENNQEDQPPKRSGNLFMIIFVTGLILLAVFGGQGEKPKMTLDQLWVKIYSGEVEQLTAADSARLFEVKLADGTTSTVSVLNATLVAEDLRAMYAKTRQIESTITVPEFLAKVNSKEITPLKAYPLRIRALKDPKDPSSEILEQQRFFADYATQTGVHYAEIEALSAGDSEIDAAGLLQAFRAADAEIAENLSFDTATGMVTKQTSGWTTLLMSFGPILLFLILFWFLFMRQMRGQGQGLLSFGRSRAKVYNKEERTGVTFDDVAGIEEAKDEVSEITEFLRNPDKFTRLGGRIPRGVMLVGPPGTGKTLLAKAIAGEADVPFISISGSDFVEMFVGVGASRVRDLFDGARKESPCIIFLDEIDAVGRKRGSGMGGGNDEREQTLNAILVEMDGFSTDDNIIVIAATNRPDVLDSALLRPGRFDREIVIDLPDVAGREKILGVHTRKVKLDPSVDLQIVARGTPGFSGAELAALVNEAAIIAAMAGHAWVTQADLEEARDKVRFGREKKSHVLEEEDKQITAYHEAGHAVVNAFMKNVDPVHKVTIIPRGPYGGATFFLPEKDTLHTSKNQLLDNICVGFGGRVAEEIYCKDITTGASSDISQNTRLARAMITRWGMSDVLGPVNFSETEGRDYLGNGVGMGRDHSQETQSKIDHEVAKILDTELARCRKVIEENDDLMERVTKALMIYETIVKDEFLALVDGAQPEDIRPQKQATSTPGAPPPPPAPPSADTASPTPPPPPGPTPGSPS